MKNLLLITIFIGSTKIIFAQSYLKVLSPADSNLTFIELAKKINYYFDTLTLHQDLHKDKDAEELNEPVNSQWKRWEWFASHHLTSNGKLENFEKKNFDELTNLSSIQNQNLLTNGGNWISLGHSTSLTPLTQTAHQGRVNCIAFHPTNPDIIYIGTAGGGIWKSGNGGLSGSWYNISDNLPVTSFSGIAVAPDGNTIYALTGDGNGALGSAAPYGTHNGIGVLKSLDGGNNWSITGLTHATSKQIVGYKIKIHPTNSNIIFAATSDGLFRTVDMGNTWQRIRWDRITDFEFKPNDNNVLYYTIMNDSNVYTVDLTTLNITTTNLPLYVSADRIELAVTPANPEAVFALAGPTNLSYIGWSYNGLYYSSDGGVSFSRKNDNLDIFGNGQQAFYDNAVIINPSNENEIIIAGVRTYRSTDAGSNFTQLNITTASNLHGDVHALERNPLNGYYYMGDDGGVYRSTDNGVTWLNISLNLVIGEYYRISGYEANNEMILGGTQDNCQFLRTSNTSNFINVLRNYDGMDNIIDYSNPDIMYACIQNGGLYKSTNGGDNFNPLTVNVGGKWVTPILQSTSNPNSIFFGSNNGILRSTNGGTSWSNIGGYNSASAMAMSSLGSRLVITDGSRIKISDNPNATTPTWSAELNPHFPYSNVYPISSIAINPANADDIILTFSGYTYDVKVFRSTNGGTSWFNYTLNLPDIPIYSIAFATNNNNPSGAMYIGTEIGVFYKDDNQPGWEPFYNGLPRVPVTDLFVNFSTNNVTAATFGRGIWRSEGRSGCSVSQNLSNSIFGNMFYQSSATINSSQKVPGSAGNSLKLRAGNTIRLTNGFEAKNGSYFHAINGPCGSNIQLPALRNTETNAKKEIKRKKRSK